MHAPVLLAFALALAVAVASPGPGIFAVVSCALGRGLREALALVCGITLGDLIFFTCAVLGMATLARSMGSGFLAVKIAGALYLAYLGVRLWLLQPATFHHGTKGNPAPRGLGRGLLAGLAVTLGNPKAIAFYAGLLPIVVTLDELSAAEAVAMGAIVVVVVGGIMSAFALAAAGSRRFLSQPGRVRLMNRIAGTVMVGAAAVIALR
jgi:threonine/homoserine/homoserine lactone efflux protein